jgi:hypothetical protein
VNEFRDTKINSDCILGFYILDFWWFWVFWFVFDHNTDYPFARLFLLQDDFFYFSVLVLLGRKWSVMIQVEITNL